MKEWNTEKILTRGEELFHEAKKKINGERQDSYGAPEDSFNDIATFWTVYLKRRGIIGKAASIKREDVAFMMSLLKAARHCSCNKRDNIVDEAGYLGILDDMGNREKL